uniref:Uncharacterized protein n=1 Tax=Rhipicephalus microplus TaxID=6941 RepID=A0A6G5AGK0_RHIMP
MPSLLVIFNYSDGIIVTSEWRYRKKLEIGSSGLSSTCFVTNIPGEHNRQEMCSLLLRLSGSLGNLSSSIPLSLGFPCRKCNAHKDATNSLSLHCREQWCYSVTYNGMGKRN